MLSLHVFDGDVFYELIEVYSDAMDSSNQYGDDVKSLACDCLGRIAMSVAKDAIMAEADHPVTDLLRKMISNADTEESVNIVKKLIGELSHHQLKTKTIPWLLQVFSALFADEEKVPEENPEEEDTDNADDVQVPLQKRPRDVVKDTITKMSR
jgi:hypothetical protein